MFSTTYYLRYFTLNSIFIISLFFSCAVFSAEKEIVILVPLEHTAMVQIVDGIKEELALENVRVITKNAHADSNILLSLVKQTKNQDVAVVMPIGTSTCQTTVTHIVDKNIICVASTDLKTGNRFVTNIDDEIPITESLSKLPKLKNIVVIYSANEKVIPEIERLKNYAQEAGINLELKMIQTLIDMPAAVNSASNHTQAFLVLKDHLVVSGINIITKEAEKRKIPVIASDEGSVTNGATIAIGVKEKEIGILAGQIAKQILQPTNSEIIPPKIIDSLSIFINSDAFAKQQVIIREDVLKIPLPLIEIIKGK